MGFELIGRRERSARGVKRAGAEEVTGGDREGEIEKGEGNRGTAHPRLDTKEGAGGFQLSCSFKYQVGDCEFWRRNEG